MSASEIVVTLKGGVADIIRSALISGDFVSPDDVVAEALAMWHLDRAEYADQLERLRKDIDDALDEPGPHLSLAEVRAHFANRRRSDEAA